MLELKSEFMCEIVADLGEPQQIGATPHGMRVVYPIAGGRIEGVKLSVEIMPFGADWLLIRSDGVGELDVRATMRTEEGELIYCSYKGILEIDPERLARIQNGEDIDPSEYYFRTVPTFETASEKYSWLNRIVCIGVGKLEAGRVRYKVYEIL